MLLGDSNARVGKSNDVDDVICIFGETYCNINGELLQICNLVVCNGRTMLNDSQWTRVQICLGYKSIIDFIMTDKALLKESTNVFVDRTDRGSSDHYLVWLELGRSFGKE